MQSSLPKTYPYNPKATTIILCILFFGACTAVLGWNAVTNDRGLILNGIFTFSEGGASIFYWILSALSMGFVLIGILLTIQRAMGSVSLEITQTALRIPHGFIKKTITEVDLTNVVSVSETEVQGQRFFYMHTPGKKYCLNRALMPSKEAYEEAKTLIASVIVAQNTNNSEQGSGGNGGQRL
jgi:hypothetical protein